MSVTLALSARDIVLGLWDWVHCCRDHQARKLQTQFYLLHYALMTYRGGRKQKVSIVDIDGLVERWLEVVIALTTAHSKEQVDKAEYAMDELLTPFLRAPIKDIREFYHKLCQSLEAHPQVPFFVWRMLQLLGQDIDKIEKDEVVELKTELATQIARMVEEDVKPDLVSALAGALQWRSLESLSKVKDAVEKGEKPRLRGKESCLFLVAGGEEVML